MTFLSIQKYFNRVHKFKAVKNGIQEQSAFVKKTHPEKLAGDYKKILIDGDLDFLKEAPFWNQEMKKIKFPMDVQKSYELSKLIP